MRTSRLPLLLLLAACSDYNLQGPKDDAGIEDDTGSTPDTQEDTSPAPEECENADAPAIAVALNDACDIPPQTGSFTPVVEWEIRGKNGYGPPTVGNITDDNGDGLVNGEDTPDVVFITNDGGGVFCVDGATGTQHWNSRAVQDPLSITAIADLEGDGIPEVIASNGTSEIVALDNTGRPKWRTAVTATVGSSQLYSSLTPAVADLDGDGQSEVIAGHTILSSTGAVLGVGNKGVGSCPNQSSPTLLEGSIPVPVDIDMDGEMEIVVGNAIYDMYGNTLASNSLLDGTVAVADFDLDGEPEFAVNSGNKVYALETDMSIVWSQTFSGTNYVGPISADDLDGDGAPEFVAVGASEMRAYRWDGSRLWVQAVRDQSGAAGSILFDFEMDGYPEIVYADETTVRVFNGLDGSVKLQSTDHASATLFETPVVADVDNDGEVEIIMQHGQSQNGLTVYGDANHSWPSGRPIWNQEAYSITNVDDDATIPVSPTPNWLEYNNFRSADAGLPPSSWNDLTPEVVDVCTVECPDRLYVTVRVWNGGTEEVPAGVGVVIRAGADGSVVSAETVAEAIPSGMSSQGVVLVVNAADLGGAEPWVEVDRDASLNQLVTECVEDNNAAVVDKAVCP